MMWSMDRSSRKIANVFVFFSFCIRGVLLLLSHIFIYSWFWQFQFSIWKNFSPYKTHLLVFAWLYIHPNIRLFTTLQSRCITYGSLLPISIVSSPPCHHATCPSTYMFTFSPFSCEISIWSFSFSFSASSCCLQIPFDEEAIRRALIAVHNFAVPQIKVLVFFHSLLSSHFVVGVCTAGTVLSLPTQP